MCWEGKEERGRKWRGRDILGGEEERQWREGYATELVDKEEQARLV